MRPLAGLFGALDAGAASDAELAECRRAIVASIRENWQPVYAHDLPLHWVRTDRPRDELAGSPDTYVRLTRDYGWSDEQAGIHPLRYEYL